MSFNILASKIQGLQATLRAAQEAIDQLEAKLGNRETTEAMSVALPDPKPKGVARAKPKRKGQVKVTAPQTPPRRPKMPQPNAPAKPVPDPEPPTQRCVFTLDALRYKDPTALYYSQKSFELYSDRREGGNVTQLDLKDPTDKEIIDLLIEEYHYVGSRMNGYHRKDWIGKRIGNILFLLQETPGGQPRLANRALQRNQTGW